MAPLRETRYKGSWCYALHSGSLYLVEEWGVDRPDEKKQRAPVEGAPRQGKRPYEPPRVLTDEAFEQIALACNSKMTTKKNFT